MLGRDLKNRKKLHFLPSSLFGWDAAADCRQAHTRSNRMNAVVSEEGLKTPASLLKYICDKCQSDRQTLFASKVPEQCRGDRQEEHISDDERNPPCVVGIDEAGRGPVLGPMVYGAAYWRVDHEETISKLGYDDSKALSKEKRDAFFEGIVKTNAYRIGWVIRNLSATEISEHSLAKMPVSLNQVSHAAAIEMIQYIIKSGVNVRRVFVDTVGRPEYYERILGNAFQGSGIEFVVRKKADSLFPVVSAASICAKVTRDYAMEQWTFEEPGAEEANKKEEIGHMGSGYPGDERTKKWLLKNMDPVFGFPSLVRFNWSTARDMIEASKETVDVEWENLEQDENQKSIMSFLQPSSRGVKRKRPKFYKNRGMETVSTF